MSWFNGFETKTLAIDGQQVHVCTSATPQGNKPALVLLHGFPQSHVMWHPVAQALRDDFHLIIPDLRGYGRSTAPPPSDDHQQMSKRVMAKAVVQLADALGVDRFYLCGHDRGGRVAHRLALDHPSRVTALCVMDIAPTLDMYAATDMAFARAYYHWFHLIQPAPVPEQMIGGNPIPYLHAKLGGWGTGGISHIEPEALAVYEEAFTPTVIANMCEDYRASAGVDLDHDRESRAKGEKIGCDTLVLWGANGIVQRLFDPMTLWQAQCAGTVEGAALACGHFLPEEQPQACADALRAFMRGKD
jgi:haloacetate dehalogenase